MAGFRCSENPKELFHAWYGEAVKTGMENPNAMALASSSRKGAPSVRFVLFQSWTDQGLTFFTNYRSQKARELDSNPLASGAFYWRETGKQVRVEGRIARLPRAQSEAYFASRPRGSQLAAWSSPQSDVLHDRLDWSGHKRLKAEFVRQGRRFRGRAVPCPHFWGGFGLMPERIEFWKSGAHRLHYRIRYERRGEGWQVSELAP